MMTVKRLYPVSDFAREHFGKGWVQGRIEGRAEGRLEAQTEGQAEMICRVLTRRFGPLPETIEQRLASADCDTLMRWAERILTATRLEEVFGDGASAADPALRYSQNEVSEDGTRAADPVLRNSRNLFRDDFALDLSKRVPHSSTVPSPTHELLVELLRQRPRLAVDLLRTALGVQVPRGTRVSLGQDELGAVPPVETRSDLVLLLTRGERVVFALVVEVQLGRDPEKRRRWPLYAVNVAARHRCPAAVLVVAPDRAVAAWAKRTISLGPHGRWTPLVVGPGEIPGAGVPPSSPELALLSVRAHADGPGGFEVARAALEAIMPLDPDQRDTYHDILLTWLPGALREELMMTAKSLYPQSDFAREHFGKGRLEGRVEGRVEGRIEGRVEGRIEGRVEGQAAVLRRMLTLRFGPLPEHLEQRLASADSDTLMRWAERLVIAGTVDEVFRE